MRSLVHTHLRNGFYQQRIVGEPRNADMKGGVGFCKRIVLPFVFGAEAGRRL